jgi:predicted dehydrogenase
MNPSAVAPLNVAVVGTGFIGPVHVEALRRSGQNVVGILGSSFDRSRAAAESLGIESAYRHLDELLADDRVQSVHITTPNRWHFEQVTRCLRAGKHVLCEKPLATSARETAELVALAKQTGLAAGVAYNIRFYPLCHEAAQRVRSGELGTVLHAGGSYVQDWLLTETDFNWRVEAGEGGNLRAVADIGTHWLDLIQFITGQRVVAVCADLQTVYPVRQRPLGSVETFSGKGQSAVSTQPVSISTEDCGCVMLRFAGGAKGCLWVSQVTAGRKNCLRFEIAGAEQALAWDSERPNELWVGHRDEPNEILLRDPALMGTDARAIASYPGGHNEGFPDTFKQLFRTFYGYIAAGDFAAPQPFPSFADGHHEVLLCEAVLVSHREQRWVSIEEIKP